MDRLLIALLGGLLATACSSGAIRGEKGGGGDDDDQGPVVGGEGDPSVITLEIETPERGTLTDASDLVVSGRASSTAASISEVTINGTPATLDSDGRFEAHLTLDPGIALLETEATDASGNSTTDARAVMFGALVDQATPVSEGVVANLSAQAMGGLSEMVSDLANSTDFTVLAAELNPVVDTGDGCNSAKVFIESIQHAGVDVGVSSVAGGIDADVSIDALVVTGEVTFRAACIGGSADFTMTADSYDLGGVITPALTGADITVSLEGVTSNFGGSFDIDVNGVPGFVENLFEGQVRTRVANILRDEIAQMVPSVANSFLGDFLATTFDIPILGQTISLSLVPSAVTWNEQGGTIVLDTSATAGAAGSRYLTSPRPRPSDADLASTGIRVALADDVLNQLVAAFWSSGALEQTMVPVPGDILSATFGADVAAAELTLFLPPVANFDTATGTAQLTIGDLLLEVVSATGDILASFVLSAQIELAVETGSGGRIILVTRAPQILAQVLSTSDDVTLDLTDDTVEAIAELAITQLSLAADDLLASIPVPGLAGATIESPTFQPAGGYLLLGGTIAF